MKTTVTESDFIDAFKTIRPDNFSYAGLKAMFEWFERYEEDCETETELDVIAICCDFSEYDSLEDFQREFSMKDINSLDDLAEHATVIKIPDYRDYKHSPPIDVSGSFIIQSF